MIPDHLRANAVDDHRRIAEIMRRDVSPDYTYGNVLEVLGYTATNDSIDYYHTRYGSLSFAMEGRLADNSGRSEDFERHATMWNHILEYVASMPAPEPQADSAR